VAPKRPRLTSTDGPQGLSVLDRPNVDSIPSEVDSCSDSTEGGDTEMQRNAKLKRALAPLLAVGTLAGAAPATGLADGCSPPSQGGGGGGGP
jgi:hypothetical protein